LDRLEVKDGSMSWSAGTINERGYEDDLVTPEVLRKIRAENRALLRASESMQASIETGRFDEAVPIAAALGEVLRQHVLLVDGVLDALTPDESWSVRVR
jgi:hypothetical protein